MAKKFSALRAKMSPDARARAEARTQAMVRELALSEIRKALDVSQVDLAKLMEVSQASVSKLESREDLHISTLAAYVKALGGEIEILAHFPSRSGQGGEEVVRLKPFSEKRVAA
ncbi:MAG: helix-turn-helix transcriptional regulator [Betaproteobacteria bacterium]|nr:helix-turn-helix transcriptional regulator [Betaproteobacteria bacterium]